MDEAAKTIAAPESKVIDGTALANIPDNPGPEPIILAWPIKNKTGGSDEIRIEVKVKEPDKEIQVLYMQTASIAQTPTYGADGKESFPNADAHIHLLIDECVISPTWLKNRSAFKTWRDKKAPKSIVQKLRNGLMLVAGLDADFFEYYAMSTISTRDRMQLTASPKASDVSPTKSPPDAAQPKSSPTTDGSESKSKSEPPSASAMTSGSETSPIPSSEPSAEKTPQSSPTPNTAPS